MIPSMQEAAIEVAQEAIKQCNSEEAIARFIRTQFDQAYPSVWHCFVGRDYGMMVSHEESKYIYFYIGQVGICLFATA